MILVHIRVSEHSKNSRWRAHETHYNSLIFNGLRFCVTVYITACEEFCQNFHLYRSKPLSYILLSPIFQKGEDYHLGPFVIYSSRNASTGFLIAARQLCQLTVNRAMIMAIIPARANIHQLSSALIA